MIHNFMYDPIMLPLIHISLASFLGGIPNNMSLVMRKLDFCICENKDADQLPGNHKADQRLCFCYMVLMDSTIPLLSKSEIS